MTTETPAMLVIEALYVATNLAYMPMPLYGVCPVIRYGDGTPGGRLYYRLTPAVFVWLAAQLANAASRMAAGEIERDKYERAATRFKAIEIWAFENIGAELIAEARDAANGMARDLDFPPAPGGQGGDAKRLIPPGAGAGRGAGVVGLPAYTEPDFGAFPSAGPPIGKPRPALEFAMWSNVEKKWFKCLQLNEMQPKPEEGKTNAPASRQPVSDPAAHPAVATIPTGRR